MYFLFRLKDETRLTRDRSFSGRPQVTISNREMRPIHIQDRFKSVVQTAATTHCWQNPKISAKMILRRFREIVFAYEEPSLVP